LDSGWHDATWTGIDMSGQMVVSGVYYVQLIVVGAEAGSAQRLIVTR
jgi:hypothetical protein